MKKLLIGSCALVLLALGSSLVNTANPNDSERIHSFPIEVANPNDSERIYSFDQAF